MKFPISVNPNPFIAGDHLTFDNITVARERGVENSNLVVNL